MGNYSSVAAIDIAVESESEALGGVVTAGNILSGHVGVKVKKKTDAIPVTLQISGKEVTAIRRRSGAGSTRSERSLWAANLILGPFPTSNRGEQQNEPDTIVPGLYILPFSIPLPAFLPSSEDFPSEKKKKPGHGFQISYSIVARLGRLETRIPLRLLSAPLPKDPVPCMIRPSSHPINSMKFFSAGEVAVGAKIGNVNVGRGEEAELYLVCQNSSSTKIRSVDIKLVEYLEWRIVGRQEAFRTSSRTLLAMKHVPMNCVNPDSRRALFKRQKSRDQAALQNTDGDVYNQLMAGKDPLFIRIPETARDSYKGQLLHVWHRIELNIHTGSLSCNVGTQIPLRIGASFKNLSGGVTPTSQSSSTTPTSSEESNSTTSSATSPHSPKSTAVPKFIDSPSCPPPMAPHYQTSSSSGTQLVARSPATPLRHPEDATIIQTPIRSSLVAAAKDVMLLGGCGGASRESCQATASAPPDMSDIEVTVEALLEQMDSSPNDYELISFLATVKEWKAMFGRISPHEYGAIIHHVKTEQDQPRVANLLSIHILGGKCFTCEYAASAVRNTSEWHRSSTAQILIPQCHDIAQHSGLIHDELSEWERTMTSGDFEEAILSAMAIGSRTGKTVSI
mmetsp:Transcript_12644/g.35075  ORF Transcript_12644/g.35075 Transcript_12644/m.35075 type:complete len:621 (+) Transcript_12644:267-2129(+)|eukprot:CAMPEP_0168746146 /NCGR_PEP_ID=MMETSP0724-20121128/14991_1 /TAXON_ID=265536 /ORGANISM="Amphiprora sp., Strain CCMP467" /LENGTH=620 /DNA_ID=CAMNT_0008793897 /DNA_START=229 /DNA_END=2091 /DNA_ORIENTATION=+